MGAMGPATSRADPQSMEGRRHRRATVLAGLLVVALTTAWCLTRLGGRARVQDGTDVETVLVAAVAAAGCLRAALRAGREVRRFWVLMTVALTCWVLAEGMWGFYEVVLDRPVPTPGWDDVGYLAAVPFAVAALVAHPSRHERGLDRGRTVLDGVAAAAAVGLVGWVAVLDRVWSSNAMGTMGGLVTVAYPLTDVVMVVVLVVTLMRAGRDNRWALAGVLAGLLLMSVSDAFYAWAVQVGGYQSGDVVDVGWIAGYLAIAAAAWGDQEATDSPVAARRRGRHLRDGQPSVVPAVAPYVPVLVALTVTAASADHLDRVSWWLAVTLVALVLARNAMAWLDQARGTALPVTGGAR